MVLVALVAGCGGSDSSSSDTTATAEWADGFCSALTTWTTSLKTAAESLKSDPSKEGLQSATDDVKGATDTFVSDVKGLGKPDTESGQQAKESLDTLAGQLQADVSQIEDAVGNASGVSGVIGAASTVTTTLQSMGTQFQTTLSELEQLDAKGELQDALEQADSCKSLTSS